MNLLSCNSLIMCITAWIRVGDLKDQILYYFRWGGCSCWGGVSSFLVYQRLKVFADEFKVTDGSIFRRVWVFTYIIGNRVDSWSLPYTWELFLFLEAVMQFRQYWWYLCDYVLLSRAMSFLQWGFWWVIRKFALHDWGESDKDSHSVLT